MTTKTRPNSKPLGSKIDPAGVWDKFTSARAALNHGLIERTGEIDLGLIALLAREHFLMVGPPGTAKSMLCDAILAWLGGEKFSYLLTKFTDPLEIFGPTDLTALKAGKVERLTDGFLPSANVCFLDEIFKASSAILNTLLNYLNERKFIYGRQRIDCPLKLAFAASNEYPSEENGGKELGALFDRFLFRRQVRPIRSRLNRIKLLDFAGLGHGVKFSGTISDAELHVAQEAAANLQFTTDAQECFVLILEELLNPKKGAVPLSNRRMVKAVKAVRAAAWLEGAEEVKAEHCAVLAHCLWDDPGQIDAVTKVVIQHANPVENAVNDILATIDSVMATASATEASAKLQNIRKQIVPLQVGPHRDKALEYVEEALKDLHYQILGQTRD